MTNSGGNAGLMVIEEAGESVANETAKNSMRSLRVKSHPPPVPHAS